MFTQINHIPSYLHYHKTKNVPKTLLQVINVTMHENLQLHSLLQAGNLAVLTFQTTLNLQSIRLADNFNFTWSNLIKRIVTPKQM